MKPPLPGAHSHQVWTRLPWTHFSTCPWICLCSLLSVWAEHSIPQFLLWFPQCQQRYLPSLFFYSNNTPERCLALGKCLLSSGSLAFFLAPPCLTDQFLLTPFPQWISNASIPPLPWSSPQSGQLPSLAWMTTGSFRLVSPSLILLPFNSVSTQQHGWPFNT